MSAFRKQKVSQGYTCNPGESLSQGAGKTAQLLKGPAALAEGQVQLPTSTCSQPFITPVLGGSEERARTHTCGIYTHANTTLLSRK